MKQWTGRIGSAVGMGLTWAVGWALVGVLMAFISEPLGIPEEQALDPWIALATPGFVGGVIFSIVLWIAARGRRFGDLSFRRLAALGAVAGLVMGLLPFVLGTPTVEFPLWLLGVITIGSTTLLSAVSAIGSALPFRFVAWRRPPHTAH